jgi:hypothetical protein
VPWGRARAAQAALLSAVRKQSAPPAKKSAPPASTVKPAEASAVAGTGAAAGRPAAVVKPAAKKETKPAADVKGGKLADRMSATAAAQDLNAYFRSLAPAAVGAAKSAAASKAAKAAPTGGSGPGGAAPEPARKPRAASV